MSTLRHSALLIAEEEGGPPTLTVQSLEIVTEISNLVLTTIENLVIQNLEVVTEVEGDIALNVYGLSVSVTPGSYRIAGTVYILSDYTNIAIEDGPASANNYRYDIVVAGTDGVVEIVKGAEAATAPVMPSTPANHVRLGWILLYCGMSRIRQQWINRLWTSPSPATLTMTIADSTLAEDATTDVHLDLFDQYGEALSKPSPGWEFILEIISGDGEVTSTEGGTTTTLVREHGLNHAHFTYTKGAIAMTALKGSVADSGAACIVIGYVTT